MEKYNSSNSCVCFFDSGIGGLNLLTECARKLPHNDFIYFADNYNVPYGILPANKILELTYNVFEKIAAVKPVAAVVACNTVTARCIKQLRQKYSFPIIGIQPAIKPAAATGGETIVIATPSTANSAALLSLVREFGQQKTSIVACGGLADYIEKNVFRLDEGEIFSLLPQANAQNIVLGCTHYIFIKKIIKKRYRNCVLFDGVEGTVNRLCKVVGFGSDFQNYQGNITFIGGDENKNKKVFELLQASENGCGEIFPKKSQ